MSKYGIRKTNGQLATLVEFYDADMFDGEPGLAIFDTREGAEYSLRWVEGGGEVVELEG